MKAIRYNLERLESHEVKDKKFTVRIPADHWNRLVATNPNVSRTIRFLICEFLDQQNEKTNKELNKWTNK